MIYEVNAYLGFLVLLRCLALLDALDERAVEAGQQPESSSAGAARAR